jgi:sulfinoalanine decarboxylase
LDADERLLIRSGPMHLVAFTPVGGDALAADQWSQRTRQALLASNLMLSRPLYQGRHHLKAVLGNPHTQPHHLAQVAQVVQAESGLVP